MRTTVWFLPYKLDHLVSALFWAEIFSLTCVKSHVCFQVMISSESFMTFFAFKWLLSSVCSFVVLKNMFVSEWSVTNTTGEHLLSTTAASTSTSSSTGRRSVDGLGGFCCWSREWSLEVEVRIKGCSVSSEKVSFVASTARAGASPTVFNHE